VIIAIVGYSSLRRCYKSHAGGCGQPDSSRSKASERMANATPEQREMAARYRSTYRGVFVANPAWCWRALPASLGLWAPSILYSAARPPTQHLLRMDILHLPTIVKTCWEPRSSSRERSGVVQHQKLRAHEYGAFLNPWRPTRRSTRWQPRWTRLPSGRWCCSGSGRRRGGSEAHVGYIAVFGWWAIFVLIGVASRRSAADSAIHPQNATARTLSDSRCFVSRPYGSGLKAES